MTDMQHRFYTALGVLDVTLNTLDHYVMSEMPDGWRKAQVERVMQRIKDVLAAEAEEHQAVMRRNFIAATPDLVRPS